MNDLQKKTAEAIVNIFETGRITGDYGAVTTLKGDAGHLTYGRSQTTLGSGNLFLLIKAYCERTDARYSQELHPYLARLSSRDYTLDNDHKLKEYLREAGNTDNAMKTEQDRFFDANYFQPAIKTALAKGINTPLGQTVVYDSFIQGGFYKVVPLVGASIYGNGVSEFDWVQRYVNARKSWLSGLRSPLPGTVYRMNCFNELMAQNAWELTLPLLVRGHVITEETLSEPAQVVRASAVDPTDPPSPTILYLKSPYMRGSEVRAIQDALNTHGYANNRDGIYGPFTETLVKSFQKDKDLRADGVVGTTTRSALGLQ